MYFGKPAVTFTIPGSGVNYVNQRDITGLEVPNRDAKAYAEALIKLSNDPVLRKRLGIKGAERIRAMFMAEAFQNRILALLQKA